VGANVFVGANVSVSETTPTGSCFDCCDFSSNEVGRYVAVGVKVGAKVAVGGEVGAKVAVGGEVGVEAMVNVMYWVVVKLWL